MAFYNEDGIGYLTMWGLFSMIGLSTFLIFGIFQRTKKEKLFYSIFLPFCIGLLALLRDLIVGWAAKYLFSHEFFAQMILSLLFSSIVPILLLIYSVYRRNTFFLFLTLLIIHILAGTCVCIFKVKDIGIRILLNLFFIFISASVYMYCLIEIIEKILKCGWII